MICMITTDDNRVFVTTVGDVDRVLDEIEKSYTYPVTWRIDGPHDYVEVVQSELTYDPQVLD